MNRFEEIRAKFLEEAKDRTDSRSIYELRKRCAAFPRKRRPILVRT